MSEQSIVAIAIVFIGVVTSIVLKYKKYRKIVLIISSVIILLCLVALLYPSITKVITLDSMNDISQWRAEGYVDDKSKERLGSITVNLVPGVNDHAIELSFDLKKNGWVLIKKGINPAIFANTKKIHFSYKGNGAPNTIELKLVYSDGTTFGRLFYRATNTNDQWNSKEVLYSDLSYFWGASKGRLNLDMVNEIHFAISNKTNVGDIAGSGNLAIDDVQVE